MGTNRCIVSLCVARACFEENEPTRRATMDTNRCIVTLRAARACFEEKKPTRGGIMQRVRIGYFDGLGHFNGGRELDFEFVDIHFGRLRKVIQSLFEPF